MADARHRFRDVLGSAPSLAALDVADERHLALAHMHLDLACVQARIIGQALVASSSIRVSDR